jgi:3-phosphoglycerate kinase
MKVLRFSDIASKGLAAGKRVFIRADLNVPQDIPRGVAAALPRTLAFAPRCRASGWRSMRAPP